MDTPRLGWECGLERKEGGERRELVGIHEHRLPRDVEERARREAAAASTLAADEKARKEVEEAARAVAAKELEDARVETERACVREHLGLEEWGDVGRYSASIGRA